MIYITSFGYLHGLPPSGYDLVLDARYLIRDPHVDPALRQLTGRDEAVQDAVMGTPGAEALVSLLVDAANLLDDDHWVRVVIGCQGGRHRSVVLADQVGQALFEMGHSVDIHHRDVDRPVVDR